MNMRGFEYNKNEGNKLYLSCIEGVPDTLWASRLKGAISFYHEAMKFVNDRDQKSSLSKNLAMAHQKILAKIKEMDEKIYYLTEALKFFQQSVLLAEKKSLDWVEHLASNAFQSLTEGITLLENLCREKRIMLFHKLRQYTAQFPECELTLCYKISELSFLHAVELTESNSYLKALSFLEDSNQSLVIAKSLATKLKKGELIDDIIDLEERKYIHLCRVEAFKELQIARRVLDIGIKEKETELLWDAIDRFRHTIRLTKGVDIEIEAICFSEIGEVFYTHLGLEKQSTRYFEQVLQLANSMVPRKLATTSWLALATQRLQDLQEKAAQKADQEEEDLNSKYYEELSADFELINQANQGKVEDFIDFLYQNYPPKNQKDVKRDTTKEVKKQIMAAIALYHPDKNVTEDGKWSVLVNEITKMLNGRYEVYKV